MDSIASLILATSVLVLIPGPNVALIVARSLQYGFRSAFVTVLGTTIGLALQLLLIVIGMSLLLEIAAHALTWIRFAGDGSTSRFALVAGIFAGVILAGDLCWAGFASSARRFVVRYASWRNRVSGIFLTLAGIGLALSQRR